jgi:L-lactate dehydrogenase (cytochrome)
VTKALEVIRKELDVTMALCGHRDIRNIRHDMNDPIIAVNPYAVKKVS